METNPSTAQARQSRKNKQRSKAQEKRVAKSLGGKETPASGALWGSKGDVSTPDFLIECKTTEKRSYSIKQSVWDKISKEALRAGMKIPLMQVDLQNSSTRLIILSYDDFLMLLSKLGVEESQLGE